MGRGIDEAAERDLLDFRPDIRHHPGKVFTSIDISAQDKEIAEKTRQTDETLDAQIAYVEGLLEIDKKYDLIDNLIKSQQIGLRITIDPTVKPQMAEAIFQLSDGQQDRLIDYGIYSRAYDILQRKIKSVYTVHPRDADDIDLLRSRKEQLDHLIEARILELAFRKIGARVVRSLAGAIPDVPLLRDLRKPIEHLADKIEKTPLVIQDFNQNNPLGPGVPLPQSLQSVAEELVPVESFAWARRIIDHVHAEALENRLNTEVNPATFFEKPIVETSRVQHEERKALVEIGSTVVWRNDDRTKELSTKLGESRWPKMTSWFGESWERLRAGAAEAERLIPRSQAFDDLNDYGHDFLFNLLNDIIEDLQAWQKDPTVLCCLLRSLSIAGKIDLSILRAIQIAIRFRLGKLDLDLQSILDDSIDILNDIIQGIMAQLIAALDTGVSGYLEGFARQAKGRINNTGCTPFDEILDDIFAYIEQMKDDLNRFLEQYVKRFRINEIELRRKHIAINEKFRLQFTLKILDSVIDALAAGELCVDEAAAVSLLKDATSVSKITLNLRKPQQLLPRLNRTEMVNFVVQNMGLTRDQAMRSLGITSEDPTLELRPEDPEDHGCEGSLTGKALADLSARLKSLGTLQT